MQNQPPIIVSKGHHRGQDVILLKIFNNDIELPRLKTIDTFLYSKTIGSWYIPYNKESWTAFKTLEILYVIDTCGTTGSTIPLSDHTTQPIADMPSICTLTAADTQPIKIRFLYPYFFVTGLHDPTKLMDIKSLNGSYWNPRYHNWVIKANDLAIDLFYTKWKIIQVEIANQWKHQIDIIGNPPVCMLYSSPQYPESILIKLQGKGVDVDYLKHISCRTYHESNKIWIIPFERSSIERIVEHYTSKNTKVINKLKSANSPTKPKSLAEHKAYLMLKIPGPNKQLISQYIDAMIRLNYGWQTIKSYVGNYLKYVDTMQPKQIEQLTADDANQYISNIASKDVSESLINTIISSIKLYYKDVVFIPQFQVERIKRPRKTNPLPKVLSIQEVGRMLKSTHNTKHICLLACIYGHGLRLSEVRNLKLMDILWDRNQIIIEKGKGRKDRYINLSQDFKELLKHYVHEAMPSYYLFEGQDKQSPYAERSIQEVVAKAAKDAGISQKVTPHTLRHCYATHLLDNGTQLPYIKELLGHANIKTTMIYTHITTASIEKVVSPLDSLKLNIAQSIEKPQ